MPKPNDLRRIDYRETIQLHAVGDRKYVRYFDGRGHFAHVRLELIPRPAEFCSVSRIEGLLLPESSYHEARMTLFHKMEHGPLQQLPMTGMEVRFLAATYLDEYSYPEAVAHAACMAFDDAMVNACSTILEPWIGIRLRVETHALDSTMATLIRFLGHIEVTLSLSEYYVLKLLIPLRLKRDIAAALDLRKMEAIAVDPSRQYRPITGSIYVRSDSDFLDQWT